MHYQALQAEYSEGLLARNVSLLSAALLPSQPLGQLVSC
jgi:hypothetical protein